MRFIQSLKLAGLLSFPPDMEPFELESLNVLIGPNGSGKSNLIEAFELFRALPTDFLAALRNSGGPGEWAWKGGGSGSIPQIELITNAGFLSSESVKYRFEFGGRLRPFISVETIEILTRETLTGNLSKPVSCYRFEGNQATINVQSKILFSQEQRIDLEDLKLDQSILSQRRDISLYPVLTRLGEHFHSMHMFRNWSFGPRSEARQPQRADLPGDRLLPDASNLAVIVNNLDSWGRRQEFNDLLKRFFPRVERLSTPVIGGTVQLLLHETGFDTPVPAARMSDGTLRFIAMLAVLLSPDPPPLVCIEEPELGLHPDAVMLMGDVLAEASERMQLVVTTHSDALVSALTNRPSAIVACERPGAGTMLRRLDPNYLSEWLEDYALGDLWRMGELGANP
ncbi:MAG: AAA family ATPase [Gammaproteobacteria bacterium]|nr:AAA family ATPase [Alphaproteobacteria bacterium]MDE0651651.1 AAA family ATPase [Gammaproteobacteria bacterium]